MNIESTEPPGTVVPDPPTGQAKEGVDQRDYLAFLKDAGITQDAVEWVMSVAGGTVPLPDEYSHLSVGPSTIHGVGLFTSKGIKAGAFIAPVVCEMTRSIAARYTNHSAAPNAEFVRTARDVLVLRATGEIRAGDEITIDYRQACAVNDCGALLAALREPRHGVVPFSRGDAFGDTARATAVADADAQLALVPEGSIRHKLYALQKACAGLPDLEMPLQHTFAPGVYVRTIFIPAGGFIVGKIHKHRHVNVLSQGHVSVLTEGGGVEDLRGPLTMASDPGTKRAVYAHTDAVWATIHPTSSTDLAAIEEETIAKSYSDYEAFVNAQQWSKP